MKTSSETKSRVTLSVSKSNLENARKFAEEQGASLSSLVDSYLSNFHPKAKQTKPPYTINEMFGFLKNSPMSNMTDEEIKDMMIRDKYGI